MLNADVAVAFVDGPYGQVSSDLDGGKKTYFCTRSIGFKKNTQKIYEYVQNFA